MAKAWYPMINYENCIECGACVDMCTHGVYDKAKSPRPVVVYPDGCVQGCKGCGSQCPAEAIEYFGDTADASADACGCAGGCDCGCDDNSSGCGCGCDDNSSGCGCGCDCGCGS